MFELGLNPNLRFLNIEKMYLYMKEGWASSLLMIGPLHPLIISVTLKAPIGWRFERQTRSGDLPLSDNDKRSMTKDWGSEHGRVACAQDFRSQAQCKLALC